MNQRRLIINADDLGYSRGVNHAIARCAREGLVRSATIMAGGEAFEHAVETIQDIPGLGIGVHLTLTEVSPVLPAHRVPNLLNRSGALHATAKTLYPMLATSRAVRESLRRELSGQIEKVLRHGIQPSHVDTHKHLHAFPVVLDAVLDVAKRYGLHWIRNPFDDTPRSIVASALHGNGRRTFRAQSASALALKVFKPYFKVRVLRVEMASPLHFYGVGLTGVWNEDALAALTAHLPSGLSEIMFHPGDCDAELRRRRTRLLEQRERERDLLLSDVFRDMIRSRNISVIRYGEVVS
jgi:chitin disaccharide deacetylase